MGFEKGKARAAFCHWEIKGRFPKRPVLVNVPSFRFSSRGNMRTYPRSGFRSGGTSECTLVPIFVPREHPPKPPFWKTILLATPLLLEHGLNLRLGDSIFLEMQGLFPLIWFSSLSLYISICLSVSVSRCAYASWVEREIVRETMGLESESDVERQRLQGREDETGSKTRGCYQANGERRVNALLSEEEWLTSKYSALLQIRIIVSGSKWLTLAVFLSGLAANCAWWDQIELQEHVHFRILVALVLHGGRQQGRRREMQMMMMMMMMMMMVMVMVMMMVLLLSSLLSLSLSLSLSLLLLLLNNLMRMMLLKRMRMLMMRMQILHHHHHHHTPQTRISSARIFCWRGVAAIVCGSVDICMCCEDIIWAKFGHFRCYYLGQVGVIIWAKLFLAYKNSGFKRFFAHTVII